MFLLEMYFCARQFFNDNALDFRKLSVEKLYKNIKKKKRFGMAINIILFVASSLSTVDILGSELYHSEVVDRSAEELFYRQFTSLSLSWASSYDSYVNDDASAATNIMCGFKGYQGTYCVGGKFKKGQCQQYYEEGYHHKNLMQLAQEEGKRTGIITNGCIASGFIAGTYAHTVDSSWAATSPSDIMCPDIASQLITDTPGTNFDLILGGGRKHFFPQDERDIQSTDKGLREYDDLLVKWKQIHPKGIFVWTKDHLKDNIDQGIYLGNPVFGLFNYSNMMFEGYRVGKKSSEPSLEEMVTEGIRYLRGHPLNKVGYFLVVEAYNIARASKKNRAKRVFEEITALSKAIKGAFKMTKADDTLIVVTSGYSSSIMINGMPTYSQPVDGILEVSDVDDLVNTVISYATGPGYSARAKNISDDDLENVDFKYPTAVNLESSANTAKDTIVLANGPWSTLFKGSYHQTMLHHFIRFAGCISKKTLHCRNVNDRTTLTNQPQLNVVMLSFLCSIFLSMIIHK